MSERQPEFDGINLQDPIGKWVGRRKDTITPLNLTWDTKERARSMARLLPKPRLPRGVFRFRSHEEANQWLRDHETARQTD